MVPGFFVAGSGDTNQGDKAVPEVIRPANWREGRPTPGYMNL